MSSTLLILFGIGSIGLFGIPRKGLKIKGGRVNQEEMFKQALKRPKRYNNMTDREMWLVDKRLGILNWDGSCPHNKGAPCKECEELYRKRK